MPCDKCQAIISQVAKDQRDEKEIIKDLVSCGECSEKIIARCDTCQWPIYNHYLTYEDSGSISVAILPPVLSLTKDLKLTQCDWCYKQWLIEKEKAEKKWKRRRWVVWICQALLFISSLILFYKKFHLVGIIILLPTVFSFPFFLALWPLWTDLQRYKQNRERKPNKEVKNISTSKKVKKLK